MKSATLVQLADAHPAAADLRLVQWAAEAIRQEAQALQQLAGTLGRSFEQSVQLLLACQGRVVVTGMGKSGIVGRKMVATFASTGMPAVFVHPAEASHGDLGMIGTQDVVLALSKSGESPELSDVLSYCRRFDIALVAITAVADSSLARTAGSVILLPQVAEVCPLGLAPTSSTTMMLALGDALAVVCMRARGFQASQFRAYHPGGKLGQKLTRVQDVMHVDGELPLCESASALSEAVIQMSKGRFGCVGITDAQGLLVGIFTDGDLRRHFTVANMNRPISELMHHAPEQVSPEALIADVAHLFTKRRIPSVFACLNGRPVGLVHVHDLLQRGFL